MGALAEIMRGMGFLKWPSLGVIILPLALSPLFETDDLKWIKHPGQGLAESSSRLETRGNLRPGEPFTLRVRSSEDPPRKANIGFMGGQASPLAFGTEGGEWVALTTLDAPIGVDRFRIVMTIESAGGGARVLTWDLGRSLAF